MNAWTFLFIYLAGAALVVLRIGWHIRYRLDKYDWLYCDVWSSFWLDVILWPLLLLKPDSLINPKFSVPIHFDERAETERKLDRLEANPPPCTAFIRYVPKYDESGECDSEFEFKAAEVAALLEKRLPELSAEQRGRYPGILNWLRQRDAASYTSTHVPAVWKCYFDNIAIGMMNRGLGQVWCGQCGELVLQDEITVESEPKGLKGSGWYYSIWCCPQGHKLLTKDAIHFYLGSG